MKQVYLTPKSSVAKTQLRATLLAGSENDITSVSEGGDTHEFDARKRQMSIELD